MTDRKGQFNDHKHHHLTIQTTVTCRPCCFTLVAYSIQAVRGGLDALVPTTHAQADQLLDGYLQVRIAFLELGHDPVRERATIDQARRTHRARWQIATVTDY